jgi:hypothetical protein
VYHGVGDTMTLCVKEGGILSKSEEKLGIFHWNAYGRTPKINPLSTTFKSKLASKCTMHG